MFAGEFTVSAEHAIFERVKILLARDAKDPLSVTRPLRQCFPWLADQPNHRATIHFLYSGQRRHFVGPPQNTTGRPIQKLQVPLQVPSLPDDEVHTRLHIDIIAGPSPMQFSPEGDWVCECSFHLRETVEHQICAIQ